MPPNRRMFWKVRATRPLRAMEWPGSLLRRSDAPGVRAAEAHGQFVYRK
jgi:hypothetical protein